MFDARHGEFEQRICDHPFDTNQYSVFADWLSENGDPRGELIALQLRAECAPKHDQPRLQAAASDYLASHADYLLGPLRDYVGDVLDAPIPFGWRHGFIQQVTLDDDYPIAQILEELLAHPSGRFVTELTLESYNPAMVQRVVRVLAEHACGSLRDVTLDGGEMGDLAPAFRRAPRVERLLIEANSFELVDLAVPGATRARFRGGRLSASCVRAIAVAPWPQLHTLEIDFGGGDATINDVAPLLARSDLGSLAKLALRNCGFADRVCGALVGSAIARHLESIDLAGATMTLAGAYSILDAEDRFPHLQQLSLPRQLALPWEVRRIRVVDDSLDVIL